MQKSLTHYFYRARFALPILVSLFFVLLDIMPYAFIPFYQVPLPLVLIVIFYFAVFRPRLLNGIAAFGIGIFADLLISSPFGLQAFIYVLMFFIANLNAKFLHTLEFKGLWVAFALILMVVYVCWYLLFSLASLTLLNIMPLVFQYMVIVLFYPLISWGCGWLNMKIGRLV